MDPLGSMREELKILEAMDVATASASDVRRAWHLLCVLQRVDKDEGDSLLEERDSARGVPHESPTDRS